MSNLYNQNIGQNYRGILNLDATTINTPLDATLRAVTDGMGVASLLQLSTIQVGVATTIARASGTNTDNPLLLAYTINNSGGTNTVTGLRINATETAIVGTTHNLLDLQVGGVSRFSVSRTGVGTFLGNVNITGDFNFTGNLKPTTGIFAFTDASGSTFNRLQLGGTTSSFPAIKRNGASIDFRLADDSGFCNINARIGTFSQGTGDPSLIAENTGNSGSDSVMRLTRGVDNLLHYGGFGLLVGGTNPRLKVGNTIANDASAIVEIVSTTKGFLMPRMTYAQMKAISTPATGLQVYNTTNNTPQVYDGTGYQILGTSLVVGTISAGATTLSCDNGNIFELTLVSGTPTAITLSNARPTSVIINLKQPAGGSATVTWATTIVWAGGSPPTLTTTANFLDVVTLIYDGTTWRGTATLNFAS